MGLNYKEWKSIAKIPVTPEDYGYIALCVSIVRNIPADKANIYVRGHGATKLENNSEKCYPQNEE